MPELPEVETIARGLDREVRGRKIAGLWTDWPKYFKGPRTKKEFLRQLLGRKIIKVERRGKNVIFRLSDNQLLLIHQKISGHLMVGRWRLQSKTRSRIIPEAWRGQVWLPFPAQGPALDPMNRFIRLILFLDNGQMIALSDLRRFAKVLCGPEREILNLPELEKMGPEPLDPTFTLEKFKGLFRNKRGRLKQVIMDQNFIAGIGNIYADEALWLARINPLTRVEKMNVKQKNALYKAIKYVLKKSLRLGGASVDDYRDVFGRRGRYDRVRYVYQREGLPCSRCGAKIRRIKIGGRSAHFCPRCQKL